MVIQDLDFTSFTQVFKLQFKISFSPSKILKLFYINCHIHAKCFRAFKVITFELYIEKEDQFSILEFIQEQLHIHICSRLVFDDQVCVDLFCNKN